MRTALKPLFVTALVLLASCAPQAEALSSEAFSAAYEGESTFRVYEVTMDRETEKPVKLEFDMEFTAKNGEPICDKERRDKLHFELEPDLSNLIGDGYYFIHFLYYDLECTKFVKFDDIATCDLNLFYYVMG
ncbi:MAG: hypothetical protein K6B51_00405 [Bacilli bacterium]|nr:hypothetical protein [Bacilli bacterium]